LPGRRALLRKPRARCSPFDRPRGVFFDMKLLAGNSNRLLAEAIA